jgi:hypothetical protein
LYATIHSIVTNQINSKSGQIYFPFIFTLFIFILINNLIGMVQTKYPHRNINNNNLKIINQGRKNYISLRSGGLMMTSRLRIATQVAEGGVLRTLRNCKITSKKRG